MLPIFPWVRRSRPKVLWRETMAGLSLAAFVIPEIVSHAHLLGLWPRVGLYSSLAAALGCAVFGRPRFRVAGTNPSLAILMAGDIGSVAIRDPALAAWMAALTALVAGLIAIAAWALRMGFLSSLLSRSVLIGFNVGAGLLVISLQLPQVCGLEAPTGSFLAQLVGFFQHLSHLNRANLAVGVGALALLVLGNRLLPGRPVPLVVLCLSLVIDRLAGLSGFGVSLLGTPPSGAAGPSLLRAALATWRQLLPLGLSVFLLSHVQDVSAAREVAARRRESVSPQQELLANGATNVTAGLLGGMPVAGAGLPPTLADEEAARAPLALVVSGALILLVVLIPAPLRYLPEATLSANLIRHALKLIDTRAFQRLYRQTKREFTTALLTLLGVLVLGPLWGIFIGVTVTIFDASEWVTHPLAAALRRGARVVRDDDRRDRPGRPPVDRVLILRIDASVLFFNAESLRRELIERLHQEQQRRPVDLLVLNLERSPMVDVAGAEKIHELQDLLAGRGIAVRVAGGRDSVIHFLAAAEPRRFPNAGQSVDDVIEQWRRSALVS